MKAASQAKAAKEVIAGHNAQVQPFSTLEESNNLFTLTESDSRGTFDGLVSADANLL